MSFITWLNGRERRTLDEVSGAGLLQARSLESWDSTAGVTVTPATAMQSAAVYACVRVLEETVASLPLFMYKRNGRAKERAPEHSLYRLLHDLPNPELTALEMRGMMMGHLCLWGNAYAEIVWDQAGRVVELWPLRPDAMELKRDDAGRLWYVYRMPQRSGAQLKPFPAENIWHIRGLSLDGLMGIGPIRQMRNALGLARAAEDFGARLFANDSRPGGVLKAPGKLTPEAAKRLKQSWEAGHRQENQHRLAVLEEGIEWQQIGLPPEDAQFLETRKFQVSEIARIFRVPPHLIGDLDKATFSNIEHQGIEFVTHTIRPWLVRIEQSIARCLLTERERGTYFAEHLVDGLLRGDIQSRYQAYALGRNNGWLSANDVRERENMNPIAGGDVYLVPMNMVPADELAAGDDGGAATSDGGTDGGTPEGTEDGNDEGGETADIGSAGRRTVLTAHEYRSRKRDWAAERRRISRSYRRLIVEAAGRVLRREEADVMRQAERTFSQNAASDFLGWLEQFYVEHREFMSRAYVPVLSSLADQVGASAAEQIEVANDDDLAEFVRGYSATAADRYARSSYGQLRQVLELAEANGDDPVEALRGRFGEWRETRAGKLAMTHTVRGREAVAHEVWARNGVQTTAWVAHGQSCPFCNDMDGRTAGITETYVSGGAELNPEGAQAPMTVRRDIGHAPLHLGCDCSIEPR